MNTPVWFHGALSRFVAIRLDSGQVLACTRSIRAKSVDPSHHRQLDRIRRGQERATTFEAVAREWLALKDGEAVTKARRLDMLERVVFGKIGALPVKQVTPAHILDVLATAAKNNGLGVAAEAKRTLSGVFELAVSTLRADSDPVCPVRKALPANTMRLAHGNARSDETFAQCPADIVAGGAVRRTELSGLAAASGRSTLRARAMR